LNHVSYKSIAEALATVRGGHADAAMVSGAGGLLEGGSICILAAGEEQRLDGLPDVPTFKGLGYSIILTAYYSLGVPKGTPQGTFDKLDNAQKVAFERHGGEMKDAL
jgi:tripartite-type tricarboxylate transporter receptor subunit TctC